MLLGAAEGQHAAIVVLQVALDLHPVHVSNAHGEFARFQVRRREHTAARCCMGTACAGGVAVVALRHEVRGLIPQPMPLS